MSKMPVFSYLGPLKIVRSRKSIAFWEYSEVNLIELTCLFRWETRASSISGVKQMLHLFREVLMDTGP